MHGPRCLLPHAARLIGLRMLAFFAMAKFARKIFTVIRWQRGPLLYTLQTLRRGEGHEPSRSGLMWGARVRRCEGNHGASQATARHLQPTRPLCLPQRVTDAL